MSPLWPDFAIARVAWDDAVARGVVDSCEPTQPRHKAAARAWAGRGREDSVRAPIRRPLTSFAL